MKPRQTAITAVTALVAVCLWPISAHGASVSQRDADPTPTLPTAPSPESSLPPLTDLAPLPHRETPLVPGAAAKIAFQGAHSFSEDQLRAALTEQINDIQERGLTNPRADDTAYYLGIYYRKQGFSEADVTWQIQPPRLVLRINEGPRSYLRKLTFIGNKSISEKTLYNYMLGVTKERLSTDSKDFPYVLANMLEGADRVRALYQSEGYLDALIDAPVAELSADKRHADVSVKISEGQRYTIGEIHFAGEPIFERAKLLEGLGPIITGPYTPETLNTLQRNLQFFFKSQGYFQAEVEATGDPTKAAKGKVDIYFTVSPKKLFRFNGITATGQDRLKLEFLERRFAPLKGKVYSPTQLDERYRELLHTGLFRTLRINSVAQTDQTIRLDLTLEEAKARELGFSLGASSYEGIEVGLRLGDRNLFGSGRPLTFALELSSRTLRSELLFVDPWLFDSNFSLRSRLYAQDRDEIGYSKVEQGLRTDISRKISKNYEVSGFFAVRHVTMNNVLIEPALVGPSNYRIDSLGLTQSLDYRDNPINPSRGWVLTSAFDADAVNGELAFTRTTARWSYYQPLGKKLSLALGARAGAIFPVTEVPLDERYFSGGATTVRSFQERRLGPEDRHNYPVGGQLFTVFNAELTFPVFGSLQGAVFADAGNVAQSSSDVHLEDMRYAIGLGLRYKLPIGPLRLDFGANPSPRKDEAIGAFHFTFGFAF